MQTDVTTKVHRDEDDGRVPDLLPEGVTFMIHPQRLEPSRGQARRGVRVCGSNTEPQTPGSVLDLQEVTFNCRGSEGSE